MDLDTAYTVLEIPLREPFDKVKKKYHLLCLKYHPDKNPDKEATVHFQKINEAYHLIASFHHEEHNGSIQESESEKTASYMDFLKKLLESIQFCSDPQFLLIAIEKLSQGCKHLSMKIMEDLDKQSCLFIYTFFCQYKTILHLSDEVLYDIKEILKDKMKNDNLIILNPTIDDIMDHNIYKLHYEGQLYYVPLWYESHIYDLTSGSDAELIVKCIPDLPEHITIDENNNIHISVTYTLSSALFSEPIEIHVGKTRFLIPASELRVVPIQHYILWGKGLIQHESQWFNEEQAERSDILVTLFFV